MAVPTPRGYTKRRRSRKMSPRMAEIKERVGSVTRRTPKAGTGRVKPASSAMPPHKRLTGIRARIPAAATGKSLDALRAAAASRRRGSTSGGSTAPGTGPTPQTTPRTRGKSAFAASRTGRPPAHGARRQGKTPGAGFKPPTRPPAGRPGRITVDPRETASATPVGSVSSTPKTGAARLGRARALAANVTKPKTGAKKLGRSRSY